MIAAKAHFARRFRAQGCDWGDGADWALVLFAAAFVRKHWRRWHKDAVATARAIAEKEADAKARRDADRRRKRSVAGKLDALAPEIDALRRRGLTFPQIRDVLKQRHARTFAHRQVAPHLVARALREWLGKCKNPAPNAAAPPAAGGTMAAAATDDPRGESVFQAQTATEAY